MIIFGSFLPSLLVGLHLQSLLGPGSRHCYGIISLIDPGFWDVHKSVLALPFESPLNSASGPFDFIVDKSVVSRTNGIVKTVGLYCRVSTSKQTNDNQLPELRAFAGRQGWEVISEY